MPRKPRKLRVMKPAPLSPTWRTYFKTGANDTKDEEGCDIFLVDTNKERMLAAWLPYREEVLAEWKGDRRKGLSWIEKELQEENYDLSRVS